MIPGGAGSSHAHQKATLTILFEQNPLNFAPLVGCTSHSVSPTCWNPDSSLCTAPAQSDASHFPEPDKWRAGLSRSLKAAEALHGMLTAANQGEAARAFLDADRVWRVLDSVSRNGSRVIVDP